MGTIEEIEAAVRSLPASEQFRLAQRLQDILWDTWDRQIADDVAAGRLDHIIAEVAADIAASRTQPLSHICSRRS